MKRKKRLLAALMSLSLAVSIVPSTVLADSAEKNTATMTTETEITSTEGLVEVWGELPEDANVAVSTPTKETADILSANLMPDMKDNFYQVGFYDISIELEEEKWQPNDAVTVTLDIEGLATDERLAIYHILDDAEAINNAIANGKAKTLSVQQTEELLPALKAAENYTSVDDTVFYTVYDSEKNEIAVNDDGTVSFQTDSFSLFIVKVYNDTSDKEAISSDGIVNMTVGETKYFYWEPSNTQEVIERSTFEIVNGVELIDYTVYNSNLDDENQDEDARESNRFLFSWLKVTAKEIGTVSVSFNYYIKATNTTKTETFTIDIEENQDDLYIEDKISENGCLIPRYNGTYGGEITYIWERNDGVEVKAAALNEANAVEHGVNVAVDRGGVENENRQMKTYTVIAKNENDAELARASYVVPYVNEIINGDFEYPVVTNVHGNTGFPNGAKDLFWATTAPGRDDILVWDVEYISKNSYYKDQTLTGNLVADFGLTRPIEGHIPVTGEFDKAKYEFDDVFPSGDQAAEINGSGAGALYQDVLTYPGAEMYWSLYHRARLKSDTVQSYYEPDKQDTMYVIIAATDKVKHITDVTQINQLLSATKTDGNYLGDGEYSAIVDGVNVSFRIWEIKNNHTQWYYESNSFDPYTVPDNQYLTRFFFAAGDTIYDSSAGSEDRLRYTVGNMIDAVSFSDDMPYKIEYYLDGVLQDAYTELGKCSPNYTDIISATHIDQFADKYLLKAEVNGKDNAGNTSLTGVYSNHNILRLYYVNHGVNVNKKIIIDGYDTFSDEAKELIKSELTNYQLTFELKEVTDQTEATVSSVVVNINPDTLTGSGEFLNNGKSFLPEKGKTYKIVEVTPFDTDRLILTDEADEYQFTVEDQYFYSYNAENTYQLYSYLTIEKNVTGNLGDRNKEFDFTINVNNPATQESWKEETFKLKHGDFTTFKIPYGYNYVIKEKDYSAEGYSTTISVEDLEKNQVTATAEELVYEDTIISNVKLTYANNKEVPVDTGVDLDIPFRPVTLLAMAIVAALIGGKFYLEKERNRRRVRR